MIAAPLFRGAFSRAISNTAKSAWANSAVRGGVYGAGAGGLWGAISDDTSVIGGALIGAGLGAGGARYGGSFKTGARSWWNTAAGHYAGGSSARTVAGALGRSFKSGASRAVDTMRSDIAWAAGKVGSMWEGGFSRSAVNATMNNARTAAASAGTRAAGKARAQAAASSETIANTVCDSNQACAGSKIASNVTNSNWRRSSGRQRRRMQRSAARAAYNIQGGDAGMISRGYLQTMGL